MQGKRGPLTYAGPRAATVGLAADVYGRMVASEVEGGVRMPSLPDGSRLRVQTQSRTYEIRLDKGQTLIWGHPEFCPRPVAVRINGSSWGGSMLKRDYLGLGMRLEFQHPQHATVTTSPILSVQLL